VTGQIPSHHIFCAGDHTVPFAALCALNLSRIFDGDPALRVYVHVDGLDYFKPAEVASFLAALPNTRVTCGLFGIRNSRRIPGRWHQIMVNETSRRFAHEGIAAFVDADFYLLDEAWPGLLPRARQPDLYCLTHKTRLARRAIVNGRSCNPIKTQLFALQLGLHQNLTTQRWNKDPKTIPRLKRKYPHVRFEIEEDMDSMVGASLEAQILGYRVEDVSAQCGAAHIGGFSHISAGKLHSMGARKIPMWLQRLRVNNRARRLFRNLGWDSFLDPRYERKLTDMIAHVEKTPELAEQYAAQEPSPNERAFKLIEDALRPR